MDASSRNSHLVDVLRRAHTLSTAVNAVHVMSGIWRYEWDASLWYYFQINDSPLINNTA